MNRAKLIYFAIVIIGIMANGACKSGSNFQTSKLKADSLFQDIGKGNG